MTIKRNIINDKNDKTITFILHKNTTIVFTEMLTVKNICDIALSFQICLICIYI